MASREWILVRSPNGGDEPRSVIGIMSMGFTSYNTAALPERVYAGLGQSSRPPDVLWMQPELDLSRVPTPLETLVEEGDGKGWTLAARAAAARLETYWLLVEDRHRLLDAQEIEPLAHQASLVEHVLTSPDLKRVLIADEVGLGKTIEAGLILKRLIEASPSNPPRVLYLTEARLVNNVCEEFERLGLDPRRWVAGHEQARLQAGKSDQLVVASMHRAVHPRHFDAVAGSGPWDVLIVDEAHHLTDYSEDGGDPKRRMRLVREILERLNPGGRLLLLSGTPHQGHAAKFDNVLELLSELPSGRSREQRVEDGSRRLIYRIKDDIRGWGGEDDLLFPVRQVNPPREVHVGENYHQWMEKISELLRPSGGTRASAWRRAQALQWAASSPEAGLGYLVRLAIRSGLHADSFPALRDALAALRPYRDGKLDESVANLEKRIRDNYDDEEEDEEEDEPSLAQLALDHTEVLQMGTQLVREGAFEEKLAAVLDLLAQAPGEKFVIFAQPVETVLLLRRMLEQKLGAGRVSLIVGEQSDETRRKEIRRFWEDAAVRVLVSSRSGGEGINLQVSRRLVHFDVPWNPMEMEQRVGRVHRYGGMSTVIVDTLVLKGSREQRVLERCRAKLGLIVKKLFGDELQKFESLFGRTMAMIPMAQIQELMAGEGFDSEAGVGGVVEEAFNLWNRADKDFRDRSQKLRGVERGPVDDKDLEVFLTRTLGGAVEPGWKRRRLVAGEKGKDAILVEEDAPILRLGSNLGYVGFNGGIGMVSPQCVPQRVQRLGLNVGPVTERVLKAVQGKASGSVRVPAERWRELVAEAPLPNDFRDGGLLIAYVVRHLEVPGPPVRETKSVFHLYLCTPDGSVTYPLDTAVGARIMRLLRGGSATLKRPPATTFHASALLDVEAAQVRELRTMKPGEPVRAVFPVAALWLEARDGKEADVAPARPTAQTFPAPPTAPVVTTPVMVPPKASEIDAMAGDEDLGVLKGLFR